MADISPLSLPPEEDEIGGVSSSELFGRVVEYEYSTGRRYRLTFDHENHVTFEWINQPPLADGAVFPPQTLSCRVRVLRPELYLVHWLNKQFGIHVSLCIDLAEHAINVAAMMPPNSWEYWGHGANRQRHAELAVLLTVLLSAGTALAYGVSDFLGAVGARRLRVLPGTTVTYVFALLTLLVVLPIVGGQWSPAVLLWGGIAGVSAIIGFLAFYAALAAGPMSLASPLIAVIGSLVPVIVAVLLGEQLPVLAWVAVVLALVGAGLISVTRSDAPASIPRKTVVLSVLAGVGLGASIAALDRAPHDSGVTAAVVEITVGVALLGVLLLARAASARARRALAMLDEVQEDDAVPTLPRARLASAGGGILLGLANATLLAALQSGSLAVVSVLVGLYPVATIVLVRIVYREKLTPLQLGGVAVALAASLLLALA